MGRTSKNPWNMMLMPNGDVAVSYFISRKVARLALEHRTTVNAVFSRADLEKLLAVEPAKKRRAKR